jgi:hypothetical protein
VEPHTGLRSMGRLLALPANNILGLQLIPMSNKLVSVNGSHFHPSLIFSDKDGAYPSGATYGTPNILIFDFRRNQFQTVIS